MHTHAHTHAHAYTDVLVRVHTEEVGEMKNCILVCLQKGRKKWGARKKRACQNHTHAHTHAHAYTDVLVSVHTEEVGEMKNCILVCLQKGRRKWGARKKRACQNQCEL
ncbi:hypothetical protein KP509_24G072500 [Ceratopteris richardii]|uniref:Uncharacterized protein n=1 Tax=Ceratopteris richardii TaxID=49495 RepID=A0A8T2RVP1_CERRI|nr:hypothetical protein KP509_24G072500 [Ceratopteris richardii]